ncbi:MAG: glutathione S-transferase, partial [Candidatus Marinimicrobia bacterium]|nr:glutathione S-transferase [Candidatus Neomarinimicrobiota bacterium]
SPKGTVPVIMLQSGKVIDQSLDIMMWALDISDSDGWIENNLSFQMQMISDNDKDFKKWLDRYKYHDRYPENTKIFYRLKCCKYLDIYEKKLSEKKYLSGTEITISDVSIFPFVRQFANVDLDWFQNEYVKLASWLNKILDSVLFKRIMKKYDLWDSSKKVIEDFSVD